jgi:hypothetical protein
MCCFEALAVCEILRNVSCITLMASDLDATSIAGTCLAQGDDLLSRRAGEEPSGACV